MGKLCLEALDKKMYNELNRIGVLKHIVTLLESPQVAENDRLSTQKYIELVTDGTFYEYIQQHFMGRFPERFGDRKSVKKEVMRILYMDPQFDGDFFHRPCQTFKEHFPQVYRLFNLIKSVDYSYLAILLQRMESFLVLDIVCREISRLQPHVPIYTIHDNIITTQGNEAFVEQIMLQQIDSWTGYKPGFHPNCYCRFVRWQKC